MKKLNPEIVLSNFVKEISDRISEQKQSYEDKVAQLELDNIEYHTKNKKLSGELSELKVKSNSTLQYLKTKEKQLEKYKRILKITPGSNESKEELLEYFSETIIPYISKKIESKYTNKIIEHLDAIVLNKNKKEEEEEELYELVLGTSLEFLYPYFAWNYIKDLHITRLKSFIRNPQSLAYENWKKRELIGIMGRYGNLSCPIIFDIHNSTTFNESCLDNLLNYLLENDYDNFYTFYSNYGQEILDSPKLKKDFGLPQNIESIDINHSEKLKRNILMRYLQYKRII